MWKKKKMPLKCFCFNNFIRNNWHEIVFTIYRFKHEITSCSVCGNYCHIIITANVNSFKEYKVCFSSPFLWHLYQDSGQAFSRMDEVGKRAKERDIHLDRCSSNMSEREKQTLTSCHSHYVSVSSVGWLKLKGGLRIVLM